MSKLTEQKRKRPSRLYFALVIADQPLVDAKFDTGNDCKLFITVGDVEKHEVIPRSTLRAIVDRFNNIDDLEGKVKISEKEE